MIWTFIRDFFVMYIFGGTDSTGTSYYAKFGTFLINGTKQDIYNNESVFPFANLSGSPSYISFGDYASTICTIIVMALIVWFAIWLVIWVFKLVSHAFLLK